MTTLYIAATPIGNLNDITLRAIQTLKEVDLILCEDTRVAKKLLDHYGIKTQTLSYHQHSRLNKVNYIIELFKRGKNLALISDAGTPGISDPGGKLIQEIVEFFGDSVKIVPIPGPTALTTAASISGFPMDRFIFLGFPPIKRKRKIFFNEVIKSEYPVIFYESPYRILRTLSELKNLNPTLNIVVAREMTKKFETIHRGEIGKVMKEIGQNKIKGEFVVIVNGYRK